jgi:hypothetical protein
MRRTRITFEGALHHVMNLGHDGEDVFYGNKNKSIFFDFMEDVAEKRKLEYRPIA